MEQHPTMRSIKLQVNRRFDVAAERVFDAFLDPQTAGKFLFATPTGTMVQVEIDAQVGGEFVFVERRESGDANHYGTYLEINRPRRLAFAFAVEKEAKDSDLVTIDIAPLEKGCEVKLIHEMKAEFAESRERATQGWKGILEGLAKTIQSS